MHVLHQDSLLCYQALSGSLFLWVFLKHLHTVCGGLGFRFKRDFLRPCRHSEGQTGLKYKALSHSGKRQNFQAVGLEIKGLHHILPLPPLTFHTPYKLRFSCPGILKPWTPQEQRTGENLLQSCCCEWSTVGTRWEPADKVLGYQYFTNSGCWWGKSSHKATPEISALIPGSLWLHKEIPQRAWS